MLEFCGWLLGGLARELTLFAVAGLLIAAAAGGGRLSIAAMPARRW